MHATAVRRYAPRKGESRDPSANIVTHKDLTEYPVTIFVPSEQSALYAPRLPLRGESRDPPPTCSFLRI